MRTPIIDGKSIEHFIPANLRGMFYQNPIPQYKYAIHDGYDPYGFSTDGLKLYLPLWALNNGGTNPIQSVDAYKHTGIVTGALWKPDGRSFDGDDDIDLGDKSLFELQDFTLIGWFKSTSLTTHNALINLQVNRLLSAASGIETLHLTTNAFELRVATAFDTMENLNTTETISNGVWFQVAFTKIGTATAIYLNGVSSITGTLTTATVRYVSGRNTLIGVTVSGSTKATYHEGMIGEVLVYNRRLSDLEIQNIYLATKWRYQ